MGALATANRPASTLPSLSSPRALYNDRETMSARLEDVAQLAGVSAKTVSNVVNGYAHVTPKTRARVEQALAQLDYRPNLSARNLRRGQTGIIALAVPAIHNPYFSELAQLVVKEAEARSLTVLIDLTDGEAERERLVAEAFAHS